MTIAKIMPVNPPYGSGVSTDKKSDWTACNDYSFDFGIESQTNKHAINLPIWP